MPIDLTALVTSVLLPVLGLLLTTVTSWAIYKFGKVHDINAQETLRARVNDILGVALQAAAYRFGTSTPGGVVFKANVHNVAMAHAIAYVADTIPDTLKAFGIDPTSKDGLDKIAKMVLARFPNPVVEPKADAAPAPAADAPKA